jgi:hypothetical protein
MVWINILILMSGLGFAKDLPKFLTKHSIDNLRFMSSDGRYAYVEKRPGVLGFVSSFKSIDFLSESSTSGFIMSGTPARQRLVIESIPNEHNENNLMKVNKIMTIDWGNSQTKEIGFGLDARLQLQDEWITFYLPDDRTITVKNIITQKSYLIRLSPKTHPFFRPEVAMVNDETIVYTEINEKGYAALLQYNLITQKATILYKSSQTATRIELCQTKGYLGVGEFPFEGINRGSSISIIKLGTGINLAGLTNIYKSVDNDTGNMVCLDKSIYFVKTMRQNKKLSVRTTEAVKLDLATSKIEVKTEFGSVAQIINMDGTILIPFRDDFYVLEGQSNLSSDVLKSLPINNSSEELPIDL